MNVREWLPEFKVSAESDTELLKYFLKTSYVDDILNTSKWMVLGRKGTGKTAIYEYIKSGTRESLGGFEPIALNFKDYPWPIHKLYKEGMEGEITAYQKSWHYLVIVQAISKLIEIREKSSEYLSSELQAAKKIINFIYGSPFPSLMEVIKSKLFRINSLSLPNLAAADINMSAGEISFDDVSADSQLKSKLKTNAFVLLQYLETILLQNIGETQILVALDQLDENWLQNEIEEYSKILINLINVCQHINNAERFKNLKIILFLRLDIYETLRFNDKNKIFQDSAVEIRWDNDSLNEMFFERVKKYKPAELQLDMNLKSNAIFEAKFVRHGATPFKHILRRSFYRPRDIVVYMNKIREAHKGTKSGLYSSKDLYNAEKDVSKSLYSELIDEWSNQKPDLDTILSVLQNIGTQTFKYEDFVEKYSNSNSDCDKADINDALLFLFLNSVIGQKITANWEYFCTNPYMQIDNAKQFHVNSGLKDRLMLTESRSSRA